MDSTTRIPSDKADVIRTKVTGKPPAPSPDQPVATRPGPRPIPDNLPRLLALATASPQPRPRPRPRNRTPWVRIDDLPPLERLFAQRYVKEELRVSWKPNDPNRIPPDVHARVQNSARMWGEKWFDDRQTATWLNIGVIDPLTAAECREAGITPQMLQLPFAIPGKALHGGRLTLKKALDAKAATVEEIRADLVRTGVLPGHAQAS